MITDEQILELAKEHLEHFSFDNGAECAWTDFAATKEQLIEFAEKIYQSGRYDGYDSGYDAAFYEHGGY